MSDLITLDELIKQAQLKGIDFGKGDPYNRLRYYTKIGWLPHMVRKTDQSGNIKGHYDASVVDSLVTIERMKSQGASNNDISKKLQVKSRFQTIWDSLKSKEIRNQVIAYLSLGLLVLILGNELGIIKMNKPKADSALTYNALAPKQVIDSGTAFVPKNQKKLFIQTPLIKSGYKVYVTFNQDYSPATRFWVSEIKNYDGFTLELDTQVFNNSEFNWWVTN